MTTGELSTVNVYMFTNAVMNPTRPGKAGGYAMILIAQSKDKVLKRTEARHYAGWGDLLQYHVSAILLGLAHMNGRGRFTICCPYQPAIDYCLAKPPQTKPNLHSAIRNHLADHIWQIKLADPDHVLVEDSKYLAEKALAGFLNQSKNRPQKDKIHVEDQYEESLF